LSIEHGDDRAELRLCLFDGRPCREARDAVQEVDAALRGDRPIGRRNRRPERGLFGRDRELETRRHDTDYERRFVIELDRASHQTWIGAETVTPQ
jgi:hypothetical protein